MTEKLVSEDEETRCAECGSPAYSIAYCTECDGGTVYVAGDLLDQPDVLSEILAILAEGLARTLGD